jgi:hypothetical protein
MHAIYRSSICSHSEVMKKDAPRGGGAIDKGLRLFLVIVEDAGATALSVQAC